MTAQGWWDYFVATARTSDGATIAAAAGVTAPQVSRWKSGTNRPDADRVVRFARHYGKPPLEGLIAAGYISAEEANAVVTVREPINTLTDDELLAEIRRRMKGAQNDLEAETESDASSEAIKEQEVSLNQVKDGGIPPSFLPAGYDTGVGGHPRDDRGDQVGSG